MLIVLSIGFQKDSCEIKNPLTLYRISVIIIEKMEVPIMKEAIVAYRQVSTSPEFLEMERMRSKALHNEAQALKNAALKAELKERKKWEKVKAENEKLRKQLAELQEKLDE